MGPGHGVLVGQHRAARPGLHAQRRQHVAPLQRLAGVGEVRLGEVVRRPRIGLQHAVAAPGCQAFGGQSVAAAGLAGRVRRQLDITRVVRRQGLQAGLFLGADDVVGRADQLFELVRGGRVAQAREG